MLTFIPFNVSAGAGCGTNWLGSDTNDPDFWVSKNQDIGVSSVGASSISSKQKLAPDEQPRVNPNPSPVNMSMPAPNPILPKPTNNTTNVRVQPAEISKPEPPKAGFLDLNGKWSAEFEGNAGSSIDLILIQTDEDIMGSGILNENGNKLQIFAKGSVGPKKVILDVKTVVGEFVNRIDKRYNFELMPDNRTLTGTYEEYLGETSVTRGNITINRLSP